MKNSNSKVTLELGAKKICKRISEAGFKAYYAGGYIRDTLLGLPIYDIDIATDATPKELKSIFKKDCIMLAPQYGTVLIKYNDIAYEVTTFRRDVEYLDGRHPKRVIFSKSIEEDANRRDFTINALYYDPLENKIIDLVDGVADLRNKIIRTVGSPLDRFEEDHLRVIRALRFACKLGFKIDSSTYDAILQTAHKISRVAFERIKMEFDKILDRPAKACFIRYLHTTGLLNYIVPLELDIENALAILELADISSTPKEFHLEFSFAVMFLNLSSEVIEELGYKLKLPVKSIRAIQNIVEVANTLVKVRELSIAQLKRALRNPFASVALEIVRIKSILGELLPDDYIKLKTVYEEWRLDPTKYLSPKPLVTGKDLIRLGYAPGPIFKEILTFAEDLQLENPNITKEKVVKLVLESFPKEKST